MLNIQNMSYLQGGIPLFQQVNLQAYANQRIGLVGKNGCGKSTLFHQWGSCITTFRSRTVQ